MKKLDQIMPSTKLVRSLTEVKQGLERGPVHITTRGREDFVILASRDYRELQSMVGMDVNRLESKLRLAFDTVDEMILVLDESLTIKQANRACCSVLDKDEDAVKGCSAEILAETPNDQYILFRLREVLENRKAESFELPASHRGNRIYHYRIVPWSNGVAMFAKDITNRSRVRDAILGTAALDSCLGELDGLGSGTLDQAGRLTSLSQSLVRLVGGSASKLEGVSIFSLVDDKSAKAIRTVLSGPHKVPQMIKIRYLRQGTKFELARMVVTQFQTINNFLNYAFVIESITPPD